MCTLIMNDYDLCANTDAVAAPAPAFASAPAPACCRPAAPAAPALPAPFDLCCLGWQGI